MVDHQQFIQRKKRKRRLKSEVERNYKCPIPECQKSYGSENSLNQHIKLKHQDYWDKCKISEIKKMDENPEQEKVKIIGEQVYNFVKKEPEIEPKSEIVLENKL